MTFLNPAMLFGLAAISAPILIHLLNKSRPKRTRWAAMKFLLEAVKQQSRKLKMQDLLLLLLRCLAVALLALIFARPGCSGTGPIGGPTYDGPVRAVVVVDTTASMSQGDGSLTRIEAARDTARELLNSMPAGSEVAVLTLASQVGRLIPEFSDDLRQVTRVIERASATAGGAGIAPGIQAAFAMLEGVEADGKGKEIIVLADSQATAVDAAKIEALLEANPGVSLRWPLLDDANEINLGITDLSLDGAAPAAGQPVGVLATIANFSPEPKRNVRVTLSIDGGSPADETVLPEIGPFGSAYARLNTRLGEPGYSVLQVRIEPDAMPLDNERSLPVSVSRQRKALIIEGGDRSVRTADRDAFFLINSLVPVPPARRETYSWSAGTAGPEGYAKLTDAIQLAVLINPPTPTAEQAARLREFVEAGGGLWIFPGPRTDGPAFTSAWEAGWLPASMGAVTDAPAGGLAWESRGFSHPVTDFWNDDRMGDLGLVRTIRRLPLAPVDGENASQVIVAYADGSPAIVEGARGNGRVVLFDSTATTEWTTLPLHPSFVALVSRLAGYTTSSSEERMQLLAGEPYRSTSSIDWLGREFRLLRVGDSEGPRTGGKVELDEQRSAVIRYRGSSQPGGYLVYLAGEDRAVGAFTINTPATESDLRQVDAASIETWQELAASGVIAQTAEEDLPPTVVNEWWQMLLWILLGCLIVEMTVARRFSTA